MKYIFLNVSFFKVAELENFKWGQMRGKRSRQGGTYLFSKACKNMEIESTKYPQNYLLYHYRHYRV